MKKISILLSVLFLSMLLTGCISIPLGDGGKLEVSKDGINVNTDEEGEGESEIAEADDEESTDNGTEDGQDDEEKAETDSSKAVAGSGSCGEFIEDPKANDGAIKRFMKSMEEDFPLPDCAYLGELTTSPYGDSANRLQVSYKVEGGWEPIFEMYEDYLIEMFGEKVVNSSPDYNNYSGKVSAENSDYYYGIHIDEVENVTNIRLEYFSYFEPEEDKE